MSPRDGGSRVDIDFDSPFVRKDRLGRIGFWMDRIPISAIERVWRLLGIITVSCKEGGSQREFARRRKVLNADKQRDRASVAFDRYHTHIIISCKERIGTGADVGKSGRREGGTSVFGECRTNIIGTTAIPIG